jgi:Fe-S-cluster-containing hydrogenase component 2
VCRVKAIVAIDPGEPPFVDGNRCYGCLVCLPACPYEAILA